MNVVASPPVKRDGAARPTYKPMHESEPDTTVTAGSVAFVLKPSEKIWDARSGGTPSPVSAYFDSDVASPLQELHSHSSAGGGPAAAASIALSIRFPTIVSRLLTSSQPRAATNPRTATG